MKHFLMNSSVGIQHGFYVEYWKKLYLLGHTFGNDTHSIAIDRRTFLLLRAEAKRDLRKLLRSLIPTAQPGKARIARSLAKELGVTIINLDMSKVALMMGPDSEANLRQVLKNMPEQIKPVIFNEG